MQRLAAVLLFLAAVSTVSSPLQAQRSSDRRQILKLDSLWSRMYQVHDTATALKLYAADLQFTASNGSRKTRAQELADVRPYPGMVVNYFRSKPDSVRVVADSAFVSGIAEWRVTSNGRANDVRRTYQHKWVRGGDLGWTLVTVHMGITQ